MNPTEEQPILNQEEDEIDLRKLFRKFLSNWLLFAIAIVVLLASAYFYNWVTTPVYRISAKVLAKDEQDLSENFLSELGSLSASRNIENEIELLKSRNLVGRALNKLNFQVQYFETNGIKTTELYPNSPLHFNYQLKDSLVQSYQFEIDWTDSENFFLNISNDDLGDIYSGNHKRNEWIQTGLGKFQVKVKPEKDSVFAERINLGKTHFQVSLVPKEALINKYLEALKVEIAQDKSSMLKISLEENIPQKGKDFINSFLQAYIQYDIDEKNQLASNSLQFIDGQLEIITQQLKSIEDSLQDYKANKGITDISSEATYFLNSVGEYDDKLSSINVQISFLDYLVQYLESDKALNNASPSSLGIQDPLLQTLITRLSELENEKEKIKNLTGGLNPMIESLEQQIQSTRKSLMENIKSIKSGLVASREETEKQLKGVEQKLKELPATEYGLVGLERQYSIKENLYILLLQKKSDNAILLASAVSDNKIIDDAFASPEPIRPIKKLSYLIALLLSIVLPGGFLVAKDYFNTKIYDRTDIEALTETPIIGSINYADDHDSLGIVHKPKSLLAESFRTVRTNLQYFTDEQNKALVYLVTSTVGSEGKSFFSMNLSSVFAMSGKKVLLVGLDLRKPKLADDLRLHNDVGISNYLAGGMGIDDVIKATEINNLDVALSGPLPPNPAELIMTPKMDLFFEEISKRYDIIIVDTPPVGLISDAMNLMKFSDVNIYLVRSGYSRKDYLDQINEIYHQKKVKNLGLVLNAIKRGSGGYGYGNRYGYYTTNYGYYEEDAKPKRNFWKRLFSKRS